MIDDMRDAQCKELFCFVVVVVVVVVAFGISLLWYYLHELSSENFAIYLTNLRLSSKSRFKNFKKSHTAINRKLIKQFQ